MEKKEEIARKISSYFVPLSDESIDLLASILYRTEVKKGELFLKEGEVCNLIGYVEKGIVRQFYYKNNKDLTEYFAYDAQLFVCIESCFLQQPTRLMVEALEPSVIWSMPYDKLMQLVKADSSIADMYRVLLEYSLIVSQQRMDSFRFETANERYARLLENHAEIIRRAPLSHIASYLLMTPETLSRVRANIQ